MAWDKRDHAVHACEAFFAGTAETEACLEGVIAVIGWRWGFVIFSYAWMALLVLVKTLVVRACCGKLRALERSMASKAVIARMLRSLVFVIVVLAPKDVREWSYWMLWFSSTGLLMLLETVVKEHFEHVVDNPRFGVVHTLRALSLHCLVLWASFKLAVLGWEEFHEWGQGPVGQVLLSSVSKRSGGGGGDGIGEDDGNVFSTDPERGGAGFSLLMLYPLAMTATEVGLSALKYAGNLLELGKISTAAYVHENHMEQITFFTRLGQTILTAARTVYMFQSCGHCSLLRKLVIRAVTIINGVRAFDHIQRAAWRVILAREMDVTFPDATEQELKTMAPDEACAICLKPMTAAKRLECQHFFHTGCLRQYLNNSAGIDPLCPICRATISWHPTARIKPNRGGGSLAITPNTTATTTTTTPTTTANNNSSGTGTSNNAPIPRHNLPPDHSYGFVPGVRPPTPDSFTRAARGADAAVRFVRRMAQTIRNEVDHAGGTPATATTVGAGVVPASGSGSGSGGGGGGGGGGAAAGSHVREASSVRQARLPSNGSRAVSGRRTVRAPPAPEAVEAVAQQLLEIFPDMTRQSALMRARAARGSVERAVELVLTPSVAMPVGQGAAEGDDSVDISGGPWARGTTDRGLVRRAGASGGGASATAARRRWW